MAEEELPGYSPQSISDILPIYHQGAACVETFTLRQTTPTNQLLHPQQQDSERKSYNVRTFATGGFMNKKPHIIITQASQRGPDAPPPRTNTPPASDSTRRRSLFRRSPSPPSSVKEAKIMPTAEVRFDIHGTGTSVSYLSPPESPPANAPPSYEPSEASAAHAGPTSQRLELYNSNLQILRTRIGPSVHYWQPHPGNSSVLELVDEAEDLVARFVYGPPSTRCAGSPHTSRQNSASGTTMNPTNGNVRRDSAITFYPPTIEKPKKMPFIAFDLGTLEVVAAKINNRREREEVLCSAIVVVERAKRRAINLGLATGVDAGVGVYAGNAWAGGGGGTVAYM